MGRVEVDRQVVTALGTKVDPARQQIRVDGAVLARPKLLHYMVNKPRGVVSTNYDPAGRPRVVDLLPARSERLFTVGRLDMSSEGLMLVTNDGELANRLAHPRYGVEKTYVVEVAGRLEREDLSELRKGVHLAEGFARVVGARIKAQHAKSTSVEIVLKEGKNREIRRLLARIGHKVLRLKRIALGPLRLGELVPGEFRPVTRDELSRLREASGAPGKRRRSGKKKPSGGRGARTPSMSGSGSKGPTIIGGDQTGRAKRSAVRGPRPKSRAR